MDNIENVIVFINIIINKKGRWECPKQRLVNETKIPVGMNLGLKHWLAFIIFMDDLSFPLTNLSPPQAFSMDPIMKKLCRNPLTRVATGKIYPQDPLVSC